MKRPASAMGSQGRSEDDGSSAMKRPAAMNTLVERLEKSGGVEDHIGFAIWRNCQSLSTAPEPEKCYEIVADHFQVTVEQLKAAVRDMDEDWQSAYEEAMDTLENKPEYFAENDWPTGDDDPEVFATKKPATATAGEV